jgi:amidohydrolase
MDKLLAGTTSSYGATYTLDYIPTAPLTFNDPALAASSRSALEGALGKDQVLSPAPTMVAEDFAFYQQKIPGFYFFLVLSWHRQPGARNYLELAHGDIRHR